MKNNLLEINFLKNVIENCNERISELTKEIQNNNYNEKNLKNIMLRQQINSFIKKRENAKKNFNNLIEIK